MELFAPLTKFYEAVEEEGRIGATHISLYMALLQVYNVAGGKNGFPIFRADVMRQAKINSRQTYNRGMNDLKELGLIDYIPAVNSSSPSWVFLNQV